MPDAATITTTTVTASLHQTSSLTLHHVTNTGWSSPDSLITKLFTGDPSTILIAFFVTLALPILLHLYFYTQSARSSRSGSGGDGTPVVLLLGPSGSGKTGLVTLLQRRAVALTKSRGQGETETEVEKPQIIVNGHGSGNGNISASPTRLSQTSTTIGMILPPGTPLGSNQYRSENDYEVQRAKNEGAKYKVVDTPGHGKLRLEQAISFISRPSTGLRGVIFLVDSSGMDPSTSENAADIAKDTVQYLHDVLLNLQRRPKILKKVKAEDVRVLIACNKQDLFTSLPPQAIRTRLESELDRVRMSKRKAISAVDAKEDLDEDEDLTVLGGGGEQKFSFKSLEDEYGIAVDIIGGAVKGDDEGNAVRKWEEWIGFCL